jgi:hypothetical protein
MAAPSFRGISAAREQVTFVIAGGGDRGLARLRLLVAHALEGRLVIAASARRSIFSGGRNPNGQDR